MNAMSTLGGLLFLVGGIAVFLAGILLMSWREKRHRGLKQSVSHFRRTRKALNNIFHAHERDRHISRQRARHAHPARGAEAGANAPEATPPRSRRPA